MVSCSNYTGGIKLADRHIKEVEFDSHGYSVVEVTPSGSGSTPGSC